MQADRNLAVPDSFMLASFMVESSSRRRQVRINNFVTLTRSWGLPLEVLGNRSASFHGWDHLQRVYLNHSSTRPRERELVAYADSADAFVQGTTAVPRPTGSAPSTEWPKASRSWWGSRATARPAGAYRWLTQGRPRSRACQATCT